MEGLLECSAVNPVWEHADVPMGQLTHLESFNVMMDGWWMEAKKFLQCG